MGNSQAHCARGERIKIDLPNPSFSGSDKIYPNGCFRTRARVEGLVGGGRRSKDVFVYFLKNSF